MNKTVVGLVCVVAMALNLFNLVVLGPHPLPLISLVLCAIGAYQNLK